MGFWDWVKGKFFGKGQDAGSLNLLYQYKYLVTFMFPGEQHPRWEIIRTSHPILKTEQVNAMLTHFLILAEREPPIYLVNIQLLGTETVPMPKVVLLYQMGKVGSSTVRGVLQETGFETRHIHYIQNEGEYGTHWTPQIATQMRESEDVWTVVTMTRNPMTRGISACFWQKAWGRTGAVYSEELVQEFMEYDHSWTHKWFEKEFNVTTGLNIYSLPFSPQEGFMLHTRVDEKPYMRLLVIRMEDLVTKGKTSLEHLLGVEIPQELLLKRVNSTLARGQTGQAYQDFFKYARFPVEWLEEMMGTQYACHFYSEEEREKTIEYWRK